MVSGESLKGLKSLASTLMVSDRPALAFSTASSLAAGRGLLDETTVAVTVARTASERPSVTFSGKVPTTPGLAERSGGDFEDGSLHLGLEARGLLSIELKLEVSLIPLVHVLGEVCQFQVRGFPPWVPRSKRR